ncbi:MAG: methyltransferase [Deltaproteobacteria bacterium]|nr:methyltransferase [Deltaproteobacteria bacterium]MBW1913814.1 methyltransferase [Deltaproteobacteria bacterium]
MEKDTRGINQDQLLKMSGGYWTACALHAGVKLDIFTLLNNRSLTSGEITEKLHGDRRGITMLLNALTAMDLLLKENNRYANSSSSALFLSKDSPKYIGHIIIHHHHLMSSWAQLDQAVIKGKPVRTRSSYSDENLRESFLMGMFNLAMGVAPRVADSIDLSGRHHMIDLGGGPGTYSIHFCLKNPQLKATIYDLSTTKPFAEKIIKQFDLTDRVCFSDLNYLKEKIKGAFDVAWLSHILHGEGHEECRNIIRKAVSALEPGGVIIIHDFILNNTMDGPLFPALFSLNMLVGTPKGQSYSENQLMDMLTEAGLIDIQRIPFDGPNNSGIIKGIVS